MDHLRSSHFLFRVGDLHEAVREAQEAGFTCDYGSDPAIAHNALIWFETGPFLEFFVMTQLDEGQLGETAAARGASTAARIRRWNSGLGWRDWAVETDDPDLDRVVPGLRAAGFDPPPPMRSERTLPGGATVSWWLTDPGVPELPFVMSSYSSPQRPTMIKHTNGATGVSEAVFEVPGPDEYGRQLAQLIGPGLEPGLTVRQGASLQLAVVKLAGLTSDVHVGGMLFASPDR